MAIPRRLKMLPAPVDLSDGYRVIGVLPLSASSVRLALGPKPGQTVNEIARLRDAYGSLGVRWAWAGPEDLLALRLAGWDGQLATINSGGTRLILGRKVI